MRNKINIKSESRKPNPENWKQTIRKRLRQSGQSYINTSGNSVPSRKVKDPCGATCHLNCTSRISESQRQHIHNLFWRLTDEQKNYFYWKYTTRRAPKKRTPKVLNDVISDIQPKRSYTFHYHFEVSGELMQVCSKFFYATLDITSKRIYYFYEHSYDEETCMPRPIQRGKNPKPPLPDIETRLEEIRKHISSFPSEIIGRNNKKRRLPAHLNITKMYKLYFENTPNALKPHWYYKVFNEEFNLTFANVPSKNYIPSETQPRQAEQTLPESNEFIFTYTEPIPISNQTQNTITQSTVDYTNADILQQSLGNEILVE